MKPIVLAVDGGNSKTDLALVEADGRVLSLVRGPLSSPHHLGVDGCLDVLRACFEQAVSEAGLSTGNGRPVAEVARCCSPASTSPPRRSALQERISGRGWADGRLRSATTPFAVLRAGTERGWGVAVVCGAGINCVGVAPDGRQARFPALGEHHGRLGRWSRRRHGGGRRPRRAARTAAAPSTSLEHSVPAHFGLTHPGRADGRLPRRRDQPPPSARASADSSSRRPSTTPSRPASSTGSRRRSSRSRAPR